MDPRKLLPFIEAALDFGDDKYGAGGWEEIPFHKFLGALMRHVGAALKGVSRDPESGLPHLAHAGANLAILWAKLTSEKS